jgi:hypothetical protein
MDRVHERPRILIGAATGATPDVLVRGTDEQRLVKVGVHHEEDLVDVVRDLA